MGCTRCRDKVKRKCPLSQVRIPWIDTNSRPQVITLDPANIGPTNIGPANTGPTNTGPTNTDPTNNNNTPPPPPPLPAMDYGFEFFEYGPPIPPTPFPVIQDLQFNNDPRFHFDPQGQDWGFPNLVPTPAKNFDLTCRISRPLSRLSIPRPWIWRPSIPRPSIPRHA